MGKYTQKGSKILVEGRLQTSSYKKNGEKKYSTDIVVDKLEFMDSKGKSQKNNNDNFDGEEIPNYEMPF